MTDDVEVQPLLVFVDPKAELHLEEEGGCPVLYAEPRRSPNLKDFMRDRKRELTANEAGAKNANLMPLTDAQIDAFEKATIKA